MTKFDIVALAAKQPQVRNHKQAIKAMILRNGGELYAKIEDYLVTPGVTGRPQFDQALVADTVKREALASKDSDVDAAIVSELSHADIWRHVPSILKGLGMDVQRGKVVGLLADQSSDDTVEEPIEVTPTVFDGLSEGVSSIQ